VSKKIKKSIKSRKLEKKITEKSNREKKPIKILKKLTGSVWFYKPETEKTEPNPNRKKQSQTGFCPKNPNRTETGQFEPVSVFFFLKFQKLNRTKKNNNPYLNHQLK